MPTPEQIYTTGIVILGMIGVLKTIDTFIDIVKKWRAPSTSTARKLENDYERLNRHDEEIKELKESNRHICTGVIALLDHEIHNGNTDQMIAARNEIMTYLQSKL